MNFIEIGRIHTPHKQAAGTPIQPTRATGIEGSIIVHPDYVDGLKDLDGFDRIWLVFWCDRATPAEMQVIPYRDTVSRGLFATRAPARPNPIGLSCVRLGGIDGNRLTIFDVDMLDGTPLLDIKPYVPEYDTFEAQRCGWIDAASTAVRVADSRFQR